MSLAAWKGSPRFKRSQEPAQSTAMRTGLEAIRIAFVQVMSFQGDLVEDIPAEDLLNERVNL
jgi:hypothetical protein